ncbi:MAG: DUF433 domain-containing protein [Elainella sp. Prado103]|nr:DUF433 domain-containing protein [Elainella sp. Prado103]
MANGTTVDEIIAEYPDLEPEDIQQAFNYSIEYGLLNIKQNFNWQV